MLLRRVIGDVLRARRQGQHRTLREVSTAANVSLGYLSEIERGQKEASSELLAAICEALGSELSDVLRDASDSLARTNRVAGAAPMLPAQPVPVPVETEITPVEAKQPVASMARPDISDRGVADPARVVAVDEEDAEPVGRTVAMIPEGEPAAAPDQPVSVQVRRNGPLRTTLYARRGRGRALTRPAGP